MSSHSEGEYQFVEKLPYRTAQWLRERQETIDPYIEELENHKTGFSNEELLTIMAEMMVKADEIDRKHLELQKGLTEEQLALLSPEAQGIRQ